jgi:Transposase
MESTGVYWKAVCVVLEGSLEIMVGNARPIKNLPGRTTDAKDCEWIGDLLRHRLIAKSFVRPKPVRELHDLTRYRRKLKLVEAAGPAGGAGFDRTRLMTIPTSCRWGEGPDGMKIVRIQPAGLSCSPGNSSKGNAHGRGHSGHPRSQLLPLLLINFSLREDGTW